MALKHISTFAYTAHYGNVNYESQEGGKKANNVEFSKFNFG